MMSSVFSEITSQAQKSSQSSDRNEMGISRYAESPPLSVPTLQAQIGRKHISRVATLSGESKVGTNC